MKLDCSLALCQPHSKPLFRGLMQSACWPLLGGLGTGCSRISFVSLKRRKISVCRACERKRAWELWGGRCLLQGVITTTYWKRVGLFPPRFQLLPSAKQASRSHQVKGDNLVLKTAGFRGGVGFPAAQRCWGADSSPSLPQPPTNYFCPKPTFPHAKNRSDGNIARTPNCCSHQPCP